MTPEQKLLKERAKIRRTLRGLLIQVEKGGFINWQSFYDKASKLETHSFNAWVASIKVREPLEPETPSIPPKKRKKSRLQDLKIAF